MGHVREGDRLSWGDAAFLYLEREGAPLHIASVSVFEGIIPLEQCRHFIESKLPLIPRYRQRIVTPPLNIGLPSWQHDPDFDIRNHVKETVLKRGTESEFKDTAATILSGTMNREHPSWDITLLRGLKGNRTGVVTRVHHCLADGVAGVGLMNVIMDPSPIPTPIPRKREKFISPPPQDTLISAVDGLISSYFSTVQGLVSVQAELLGFAENLVSGRVSVNRGEMARFLPELTAPTQRLPFNVVCKGPQKFAWTDIPIGRIKAVRETFGGTLNDVILTIVTLALQRYAELHEVKLEGRLLRIVVPVNLRGNSSAKELGNRISFVPLTIPFDIRDPRRLLAAISERMNFLKNIHAAELIGMAGPLLGMLPTAIQALAGPVASKLPLSVCNIICTNVPGPQVPLYLLGHRMQSWYPYVPIGGEMGINTAILSYNKSVYFGFTGDVAAAPDLLCMEKLLRMGFVQLCESASATLPQKKRLPKNRSRNKRTKSAEAASQPPRADGVDKTIQVEQRTSAPRKKSARRNQATAAAAASA